jgi:hypothetical protein
LLLMAHFLMVEPGFSAQKIIPAGDFSVWSLTRT